MYDIITIGSGTVDAFIDTENKLFTGKKKMKIPFGSKILIENMHFDSGGGGTNTAVAFSRLGFKTAWIGSIGESHNSQRIIEQMRKEKVDTRFVKRKRGRTGFSVILDAAGHERTILAFKGSNDNLLLNDVPFRKLKTKWMYLSSMMGVSYRTIEKVAAYATNHGIQVGFNCSSYLARKGKGYLKNLIQHVDVLILNKEEAGIIIHRKNIRDLLKRLKNMGPSIVVITDGKRGAYAYDGVYCHFIQPRKIPVVESTGAGDAFAAGFIAGLMKKGSIDYGLQLGLKEAESVITHHGAKNKLLTQREAARLTSRRVTRYKI